MSVIFYIALFYLCQAVLAAPSLLEDTSQKTLPSLRPSTTKADSLKVPGHNPARYCSDPSDDVFQISALTFYPVHPKIGYYFTIAFWGYFSEETGANPWLNISGSSNGRPFQEEYNSPLCDIDIFQKIPMPTGGPPRMHRSCPPGVHKGYATVTSPPIPLYPMFVEPGEYHLRAESLTAGKKRIFCVEGKFNITKPKHMPPSLAFQDSDQEQPFMLNTHDWDYQ